MKTQNGRLGDIVQDVITGVVVSAFFALVLFIAAGPA